MSRDNHQDIVQQVHNAHPPQHTVEGTLVFLARVLAALPRDERAGMLRKDAGENIASFHGVMVSVGRVCYPDGQLYKIATDIPTTLAPVWNDDGPVEPSRYFDVTPFLEEWREPSPSNPPEPLPEPTPEPAPSPLPDEFDKLFEAMERIIGGLEGVRSAVVGLDARIAEVQQKGISTHVRLGL